MRGGDNRTVIDAQLIDGPNSGQTIDTDAGLGIDVEDLGLAVDMTHSGAHRAAIIDEETVQPSTEDEDIAGFGHVQSPSRGLVVLENRILPFREGGEERGGGRWIRLEVGGFGLRKTEVVVRGASEVVIDDNVVLRPSSNEPNRTLGFGQKATAGINGRLVAVQGLDVVVGEPDPSTFEVSGGVAGQVDGQKSSEAVAVSDVGRWALGYLEVSSSSTPKTDIGIPHSGAALGF